jgi:hypothetical protein
MQFVQVPRHDPFHPADLRDSPGENAAALRGGGAEGARLYRPPRPRAAKLTARERINTPARPRLALSGAVAAGGIRGLWR